MGEDSGERMRRVARDPGEDLDRAPDGAGRAHEARKVARVPAGAFAATTFAASEDATIGAMNCEPQRGCSFGAGSPPFSYVPIEMCSAPWYAARIRPAELRGCGKEGDTGGGYLTRACGEP